MIGSVAILDTAYSGEPSFNGLLALDLDTGTLLWETIGVINYFGNERTQTGDWQVLVRSDEWLGPYNPIYRPGVFIIEVYDLYKGLKEERFYDLNPETCQSGCPSAQWVEQVAYENGFIYAQTKTNGVSRFPLEKDFAAREQATFPDEVWLAGPYQNQLFTSDGQSVIVHEGTDLLMGSWGFGNAPVSHLDVEDQWLLVGFKNGDFALADIEQNKVIGYWNFAKRAFDNVTFQKSHVIGNTILVQVSNTLYALEFPH